MIANDWLNLKPFTLIRGFETIVDRLDVTPSVYGWSRPQNTGLIRLGSTLKIKAWFDSHFRVLLNNGLIKLWPDNNPDSYSKNYTNINSDYDAWTLETMNQEFPVGFITGKHVIAPVSFSYIVYSQLIANKFVGWIELKSRVNDKESVLAIS